MTRYRMSDGMVVDTANASQTWEEATRWDGRNHISIPTGSQWHHETLHRSKRGRYYLERTSNYESETPTAEWISNEEAVRWLLTNNRELPDDLQALAADLTE
jgi:hypothetical protein